MYEFVSNDPINGSEPSGLHGCAGSKYDIGCGRFGKNSKLVGAFLVRAAKNAQKWMQNNLKCKQHIQDMEDALANIQRRTTWRRWYAALGEADDFHKKELERQIKRWNDTLDDYHRDRCNDDDDDFRFIRNIGLQWTRLPIADSQIPDWRTNRFSLPNGLTPGDMTPAMQQSAAAGWGALFVTAALVLAF